MPINASMIQNTATHANLVCISGVSYRLLD